MTKSIRNYKSNYKYAFSIKKILYTFCYYLFATVMTLSLCLARSIPLVFTNYRYLQR